MKKLIIYDWDGTLQDTSKEKGVSKSDDFNPELVEILINHLKEGNKLLIFSAGASPLSVQSRLIKNKGKDAIQEKVFEIIDNSNAIIRARKNFDGKDVDRRLITDEMAPDFWNNLDRGKNLKMLIDESEGDIEYYGNDITDQKAVFKLKELFSNRNFILRDGAINEENRNFDSSPDWPQPQAVSNVLALDGDFVTPAQQEENIPDPSPNINQAKKEKRSFFSALTSCLPRFSCFPR